MKAKVQQEIVEESCRREVDGHHVIKVFSPTGPVKPPPSGSSLPDRFDRKPVEFKSKFKIACVTGSDRFDRFTGPV